jgi:hypothetical protein
MKRREFHIVARAARPLVARAQPSRKLSTIGVLGPRTPSLDSVRRLRELGWIEASQYCDRVSLRRGTQRAPRRVRGRFGPNQRGCHCHVKDRSSLRGRASNVGHSDRLRCGVGDPDGTGPMDLAAVAQVPAHKWSGCWGIADAVARSAGGSPPALLKITSGTSPVRDVRRTTNDDARQRPNLKNVF